MIIERELQRIIELDKLIRNKRLLLDNLSEMARSVPSVMPKERVMQSVNNDPFPLIDDIVSVSKELEEYVREQAELKIKTSGALRALRGREEEIVSLRYIHCKTFESIAETLDISLNSVYVLHKKAKKKILR